MGLIWAKFLHGAFSSRERIPGTQSKTRRKVRRMTSESSCVARWRGYIVCLLGTDSQTDDGIQALSVLHTASISATSTNIRPDTGKARSSGHDARWPQSFQSVQIHRGYKNCTFDSLGDLFRLQFLSADFTLFQYSDNSCCSSFQNRPSWRTHQKTTIKIYKTIIWSLVLYESASANWNTLTKQTIWKIKTLMGEWY
jgi:hypothetical protein